eukprot:2845502-Rhodomonas_salina.2
MLLLPGVRSLRLIRAFRGIDLRFCYVTHGTDVAYGGSCLCACYAIPGTHTADGATCLRACYEISRTDPAYGGTSYQSSATVGESQKPHQLSHVRYPPTRFLRASYAMPGTHIAHGAISLCECDAMPSADITSHMVLSPYALCTRCPLLSERMVLQGVSSTGHQRYAHSLPYLLDLRGTKPCYRPTRALGDVRY